MGRTKRVTEEEHFFKREFDIDLEAEYERLRDLGTIRADELKDKNTLMKYINKASYNAHRANMIYLKARKARELYKPKFAADMRELSRKAISRLQAWLERSDNKRKQITKDMVLEEICAADDTREKYEALIQEQEELKEIRDNLQNLAIQWSNRTSLLQTQASLLKYEKTVVLGKD